MSITMNTAQALNLWQNVNLALVRGDAPDLSSRQIAILLTIYLQSPPHTIRALAQKLQVTKPVITRALDSMGALGLVSRRRDESDKRNVLIQRTVKGSLLLENLGDLICKTGQELGGYQ